MIPKALATGLLVAAGILASSSVATAEYVVPPGNSAANQGTEALPTANGEAAGDRQPRDTRGVLGRRAAAKLYHRGPGGRAVAEYSAATAPATPGTKFARARARVEGHTGAPAPLGEIAGKASGVDSEPLLVLVIAAGLVWAGIYVARRRRAPAGR